MIDAGVADVFVREVFDLLGGVFGREFACKAAGENASINSSMSEAFMIFFTSLAEIRREKNRTDFIANLARQRH